MSVTTLDALLAKMEHDFGSAAYWAKEMQHQSSAAVGHGPKLIAALRVAVNDGMRHESCRRGACQYHNAQDRILAILTGKEAP